MIAYIVGYVLIVVIWFFYRIKPMRRNKDTKEMVVFGGILGVSLLIGSLLIAHVDLPSFILACQFPLEPIGKYLLKQ
ncbi:hypothetical protein BK138_32600 [Paenibacillus rhizosphaerae]|uniref:Uncharacterized protein n=1 Tax=Paenibacillus rhizosphaerae TaxID=297318 RepID=A0A1R1E574_9BACL|nr:hypothetical protein [Paenibacillus rhizosphaerae]OMF46959.1 hypothetical protein BK138_32600 [Paenibacillus rhizosphaerae]